MTEGNRAELAQKKPMNIRRLLEDLFPRETKHSGFELPATAVVGGVWV